MLGVSWIAGGPTRRRPGSGWPARASYPTMRWSRPRPARWRPGRRWRQARAGTLEPSVDEGFYAAGPDTALDLLRGTPADARVLVVVGHNPTIAHLAQLLDDGEGDPEASNAMASGFPTSAVAVFEYDGAWADLDLTSARLVAFHVGRG